MALYSLPQRMGRVSDLMKKAPDLSKEMACASQNLDNVLWFLKGLGQAVAGGILPPYVMNLANKILTKGNVHDIARRLTRRIMESRAEEKAPMKTQKALPAELQGKRVGGMSSITYVTPPTKSLRPSIPTKGGGSSFGHIAPQGGIHHKKKDRTAPEGSAAGILSGNPQYY